MYRLHGAIHAYGGTTVSARDTADSVITALTPAAWYRNATGVTSAGGFASQWDDYSGNGKHLVQATGTNQPAYAAGVFTFDGADNTMKTAAIAALTSPVTYYLVFKMVAWTVGDYVYDGNTVNSGVLAMRLNSPELRMEGGANLSPNGDLSIGSFGIVACVWNGASSSLRVNNSAAITGDTGVETFGGFTLASRGDIVGLCPNIQVKEIVLFAAAHDATTQSSIITALNNALTVF